MDETTYDYRPIVRRYSSHPLTCVGCLVSDEDREEHEAEHCWTIKDAPVSATLRTWASGYEVRVAAGKVSYERWERLLMSSDYSSSSYDYTSGAARAMFRSRESAESFIAALAS